MLFALKQNPHGHISHFPPTDVIEGRRKTLKNLELILVILVVRTMIYF